MDQVNGAEHQVISDELRKIVEDLTDPLRPDDRTAWEVRPLRDDDDSSHYPEYLVGDIPRYWWVSIEGRSMVADLKMPSASRIYFMADMAQDEVIEESGEARPWCPVHAKNMLNIHLEEDEVFWQCPDDEHVRCEFGGYWAWRHSLGE